MKNERAESLSAIGERLRLTRKALGLKQAAFCRLTGVAPTAWNNYERGLRRISLDEAMKVSAHTGVSLDWIYRGLRITLPQNLVERIRELENDNAHSG